MGVFGEERDNVTKGARSMDAAKLKEFAQAGNPRAIAALLSQHVLLSDLTIKASVKGDSLHLLLESNHPTTAENLAVVVQNAVAELQLAAIQQVVVYGRQAGHTQPDWRVALPLAGDRPVTPPVVQTYDAPVTQAVTSFLEERPQSPVIGAVNSKSVAAGRSRPQPGRHPQKRKEPFVLTVQDVRNWLKRVDPFKVGFMAFLAAYGLFGSKYYTVETFLEGSPFLMRFIHGANLIFHEAGHVIFMILGEFMTILGGSLFQILLPAAIAGYFVFTRQLFAAAVAACWTGENFWDVSIYIKDSQSLVLPLLGGDNGMHDWNYLLSELGWLTQDQLVGGIVFWLGWLIYAGAIGFGFYFSRLPVQQKLDFDESGS